METGIEKGHKNIEVPRKGPHTYGISIYDKGTRQINGECEYSNKWQGAIECHLQN